MVTDLEMYIKPLVMTESYCWILELLCFFLFLNWMVWLPLCLGWVEGLATGGRWRKNKNRVAFIVWIVNEKDIRVDEFDVFPSYNWKKQTSASEHLVVKVEKQRYTDVAVKNIFAKGETICMAHLFMPEATEYNKWETN